MITVSIDGQPVALRTILFSGGEVQPRLIDPPPGAGLINIRADVWSSDDLMELLLVTDALRRIYPIARPALTLPYLPYARQDRVCYHGEAFSLSVIAVLLRIQPYASIEVWDPHSDVAQRLLASSMHAKPALDFVRDIPALSSDKTVIVAPDDGAFNRAMECAEALYCPIVRARKTRNPGTGELGVPTVSSEHIGARDFLIVDDICDGGRTFVNLAKVLRPLTDGRIYLYVTHGIFSQGLPLDGIDWIYTANPHPNYHAPKPTDRLSVLSQGAR